MQIHSLPAGGALSIPIYIPIVNIKIVYLLIIIFVYV